MDFFTTQPGGLAADVILVAFVLLLAYFKSRKGLYNCFMPIVILVLSLSIAVVGSRIYAPSVTEKVLPVLSEKIAGDIVQQLPEIDISKVLPERSGNAEKDGTGQKILGLAFQFLDKAQDLKVADSVKEELKNLDLNNEPLIDTGAVKDTILNAVSNSIKTLTHTIVRVLLFVAIFLACLILLNILKLILENVSNLPVIHAVDTAGGFVIGFAEGFIIVLIAVKLFGILGIDFFKNIAPNTLLLKWLIG